MNEIERKNGEITPANAHDVVATVSETFAAKGIPLPRRYRGMIAKNAKELLEDGFEYETVVIAAVIACRRGQPYSVPYIASDLVMARSGERMTRREYEKALEDEMEVRRERS